MRVTSRPVAPHFAARPVAMSAPGAAPRGPKPVAARAADPLPTFGSSSEYRHYVINLVGLAQITERDLEAARKALNAGTGTKAYVDAVSERLDSIKLQLAILRDQYEIPGSWTRPKWLLGEGFDKDAFWREQVEAIPGKEVVVTPQPPKPQPPKPQPEPAPPKPPATPGDPAALAAKFKLAELAAKNARSNSDRDAGVATALRAALPLAGNAADCVEIARYAAKLSHSNSRRNQLVTEAMIRGVELVRSPEDAIMLAKGAASHAHGNSTRDDLVRRALERAIALATTTADCEAIMNAAHSYAHSSSTVSHLVNAALARAGAL